MATTTLATVDALLKEIYEKRVRDQLQSETVVQSRLEQTSEGVTSEVGGKYVTFPIRTKRNHGIGARAENTVLPVARTQSYQAARISLAYLYGSIELTGQTMELAKTNEQAFASALDQEMNGLKETLRKDTNRQTFGTSAGIIGAAVTGTTTTMVMPDAAAIYFEEDMQLDIWDDSGAALHTNAPFTVSTVVSSGGNTTVTFTPAAGAAVAVGDTAHRYGSRNLETIGLQAIVAATGTLYNIDPTSVGVWKSVVNANGGTTRALSEGLMMNVADEVRRRGGSTSAIFTTHGVYRSYANLLVQQRRYNDTVEFKGGFNGLKFTTPNGDIPVVPDWDCQANRMYFVNEKELKIYRESDWSWMDRDGSIWQRKITSAGKFDAYEATMYKYCQLGTHRRNSHALLSDITES